MRRLWALLAGLSVLLVAFVVYTWPGDGASSLNPVAEAAERTQGEPGARVAINTRISKLGETLFTMGGQIAFNGRTKRSRGVLNFPLPPPVGNVKMFAVADEQTAYMRSRLFADGLPPGRRWMAVDASLGIAPDAPNPAGASTEQQLEMLSTAGDVKEQGREDVRGVSTTRYDATIDFLDYAETLRREGKRESAGELETLAEHSGPMDAEVWIDDDGLVREMRLITRAQEERDGETITTDMRFEFYDFGIEPAIRLPRPSEVFDATPQVRAELGLPG